MGNWQLEVGRMAMYMTYPVALFYLFNQPAYFEEWVTKTRRELYPPDKLSHHEELQQAIRKLREQRNVQMLEALAAIEMKEAKK